MSTLQSTLVKHCLDMVPTTRQQSICCCYEHAYHEQDHCGHKDDHNSRKHHVRQMGHGCAACTQNTMSAFQNVVAQAVFHEACDCKCGTTHVKGLACLVCKAACYNGLARGPLTLLCEVDMCGRVPGSNVGPRAVKQEHRIVQYDRPGNAKGHKRHQLQETDEPAKTYTPIQNVNQRGMLRHAYFASGSLQVALSQTQCPSWPTR